MPCTNPLTPVIADAGFTIITPDGPEIFDQEYETIVPSVSTPKPFNVILFAGNTMVWLGPALAAGARFPAAFTVTCMVSRSIAPLLSVTFSSNL